jgi:hypothetical protein
MIWYRQASPWSGHAVNSSQDHTSPQKRVVGGGGAGGGGGGGVGGGGGHKVSPPRGRLGGRWEGGGGVGEHFSFPTPPAHLASNVSPPRGGLGGGGGRNGDSLPLNDLPMLR